MMYEAGMIVFEAVREKLQGYLGDIDTGGEHVPVVKYFGSPFDDRDAEAKCMQSQPSVLVALDEPSPGIDVMTQVANYSVPMFVGFFSLRSDSVDGRREVSNVVRALTRLLWLDVRGRSLNGIDIIKIESVTYEVFSYGDEAHLGGAVSFTITAREMGAF